MARSRNIKPSLFKNEILGVEDPLLTILFEGLWCLADRDGKLEDRPMRIKAEIFPYRDLGSCKGEAPGINGYLTVLQQLGFIDRYSVENVGVIKVLAFSKHQSPHKTEKGSDLPDKPLETGVTVKEPLKDGEVTDGAALIPDSLNLIPSVGEKPKRFCPPTQIQVTEYFKTRGCHDEQEAEKFVNFYTSKNWYVGKNKMKDWEAAARNWVSRNQSDAASVARLEDSTSGRRVGRDL